MVGIDEGVEIFAELLKAISHPVRLCIVRGLSEHSCNVSSMRECLAISQPTLSKHVAILKAHGIIKGERRGTEVIYRLVDKDILKIVTLLQRRYEKGPKTN